MFNRYNKHSKTRFFHSNNKLTHWTNSTPPLCKNSSRSGTNNWKKRKTNSMTQTRNCRRFVCNVTRLTVQGERDELSESLTVLQEEMRKLKQLADEGVSCKETLTLLESQSVFVLFKFDIEIPKRVIWANPSTTRSTDAASRAVCGRFSSVQSGTSRSYWTRKGVGSDDSTASTDDFGTWRERCDCSTTVGGSERTSRVSFSTGSTT